MKYITRDLARRMTCKLETQIGILDKTAYDYVVQLINVPYGIVGYTDCLELLDGFSAYIETAYSGRIGSFEDIAEDYNKQRKRKFLNGNGLQISFKCVCNKFLKFMCLAENYGKRYTTKGFNKFLSENYREVLVNG